jgi:hypothetical protein
MAEGEWIANRWEVDGKLKCIGFLDTRAIELRECGHEQIRSADQRSGIRRLDARRFDGDLREVLPPCVIRCKLGRRFSKRK